MCEMNLDVQVLHAFHVPQAFKKKESSTYWETQANLGLKNLGLCIDDRKRKTYLKDTTLHERFLFVAGLQGSTEHVLHVRHTLLRGPVLRLFVVSVLFLFRRLGIMIEVSCSFCFSFLTHCIVALALCAYKNS
jgi:hypothetical protein